MAAVRPPSFASVKTKHAWARWAPLLIVAGIVAACGPAVTPTADAPAPAPTPAPAEPQVTCDDLAIQLLERGAGIHGAIVADTLHMGGAEAPVTCAEPANLSLLADLSIPEEWTAQAQQSQYYLIVIRYPGGNRLYVISRRSDGTSCVVDTNDQCIAQVTELPDGFDPQDLPEDVTPIIPAGRPAPPTVSPPPDGGYTPPVVPAPPAASAPAAAGNPQPRDGATGVAVETLLLSWSAAARAASYDVYWGREEHLTADADLGTPIGTTFTATTIRRPALSTTYYWRVDAKNDQGTTTGGVWSFTTADRAAPPSFAPGGGYTPPVVSPPPAEEPPPAAPAAAGSPLWSDEAKRIRITEYAHQTINVPVPWPSGNPRPEVTTPFAYRTDYRLPIARGFTDLEFSESHVTITGYSSTFAESGTIVLIARNSLGSAELSIPFTVSCGYSMQDAIDMWIGTHSLPTAPANERPNESFHGSTSITITSTGVTFGNNTAIFRTKEEMGISGVRNGCNQVLYARTAGGTEFHLYDGWHIGSTHNIYKNLHKGGSSPACGTRWFDASVITERRRYGDDGRPFVDNVDGAKINHSACD